MARSRNIKPGFYKNEHLAAITAEARLLFIGLWCLADCEGRLEDRPARIKAEIFPYEDNDVDRLLDELAQPDESFIQRYKVEGKEYIQVVNFLKHQNPHKKERESGSRLPKRPDPAPEIPGQDPTQIGTSPADSLNLIPDSPTPLTEKNKFVDEGYQYYLRQKPKSLSKDKGEWVKPYLEKVVEEYNGIPVHELSDAWSQVVNQGLSQQPYSHNWFKSVFEKRLQGGANNGS